VVIAFEKLIFSICAKVEHPFRLIKYQFGFVKARYKGLCKNDSQLAMLFRLERLFRMGPMVRAWAQTPYLGGNKIAALNNENLKCGHVTHDGGATNLIALSPTMDSIFGPNNGSCVLNLM
jgi:hypothetical protein